MRRPLIFVAALLALCVLPAAALAQGAGDEQYADPFGEVDRPDRSQQSQDGTDTEQNSAPTPAAEPVVEDTAAAESSAAPASQLPRTGLEIVPIALLGVAMLLAGVAISRSLALAARRN